MDFLNDLAGTGVVGGTYLISVEHTLTGLLLAFLLGQCAAWVYIYTHTGLSYSKSFVQSIILLTIIISMGMMVIGNNIVIALGVIGAFAVVRFRNILKDTRDTAFIFFALVAGMATGTERFALGVLGTFLFCAVLLYLHWSQFGDRDTGDGFLRCSLDADGAERIGLQGVLDRHCRSTHLVSQRFQEHGGSEYAYRLSMRNPARADDLVTELNALSGIRIVAFVLHEEESEV